MTNMISIILGANALNAPVPRARPSGVKRTLAARGFVPASINRNTGKPHEHTREIARRERQGRPL